MSDNFSDAPAEMQAEQSPVADAEVAPVDHSPEPTPHSAVDRAFDALDTAEEEAASPPEATEEKPTSERPRTPDGKFAKKEAGGEEGPADPEALEEDGKKEEAAKDVEEPKEPAPSRFSPDAKAAWKEAPEPVRTEVARVVSELESGLEKYRQEFEPFKAFAGELEKNGQTFEQVLGHYTGIEEMLVRDPMQGLDTICQNLGTSLREVAEKVTGQQPNEAAAQQDAVYRAMRQEIASLKQELGGVSNTLKTQSEQAAMDQLNTFAADKPRFEELSDTMAKLLDSGVVNDITEAYTAAEKLKPSADEMLKPSPQAPVEPAPADPAPEAAQTRKGALSLGSRGTGSNPSARKKPITIEDSLEASFARVGL